jgi:ABC-type glutathione transport system ATPase component
VNARLRIRGLEVAFGERVVVALDELDVGAGEIVGLVGESGSGKSMTALATLGLASAAGARVAGSITIDGLEVVGLSEARLRDIRGTRIAMIFQNPIGSFNPVLRIGDVFVRALRLHGAGRSEARRRCAEAFGEVMLTPELLDRYPHQLSGGQAQRAAIALAVALRAEVLLADEPTSALDVTVQAEVLDLLRRLRDLERLATLFISHDLAVVAQLCDRVTVLRGGRVQEAGTIGAVLHHPQHPYTRELIAAVPTLGAPPLYA